MAAKVSARQAALAPIARAPVDRALQVRVPKVVSAPIATVRPGLTGSSGRIASRPVPTGPIGPRARRDSSKRFGQKFPRAPSRIDPSAPCVRFAPIGRSGRCLRALD
jgi:hypothetical protein